MKPCTQSKQKIFEYHNFSAKNFISYFHFVFDVIIEFASMNENRIYMALMDCNILLLGETM